MKADLSAALSHERGVRYFAQQRFAEAAIALAESLGQRETSEGWNDWAAAELAAGQSKAEKGFRRALALDSSNQEAAGNLGAFLSSAGRHAEAIPYLEQALAEPAAPQHLPLQRLLNSCRSITSAPKNISASQEALRKFLAPVSPPAPTPPAVLAPSARPPFYASVDALAALRQEIATLDWYHQIDIGHGIVTPGCHSSAADLRMRHFPARLDGLTVLDIGAWDGLFSFEAERRGARRVLGTDGFAWCRKCPRACKKGFDLAHWALNSKVESLAIDLREIYPERIGSFDVVLLDALYTLRHPLAALDHAFSVTSDRGWLILHTHTSGATLDSPALAFSLRIKSASNIASRARCELFSRRISAGA